MLPGLAITWSLSSVTAYGIHGLTLAQQYLSEGENLVLTSLPTGVYLNPLQQRRIQPYLDMAPKLAEILKNNPHEKVTLRMPAFHAVGNDFLGFPGQFQVRGSPNVGGAAIEYCTMSDEAKGVGKFYDKIIAYSHYTADFLSSLNVAPVVVCHQGVDTGMFHPRQKSGLYKNRFVIFSGGKFEHRKGQDIVLAAFKHFAARHDDALLVCAWQTIMPIQGFPLRPYSHLTSLPAQEPGQPLHLDEWLLAEGLHPRQVIALPFLPQATMPSIMAECDVAVFPSR
ncbi:MAG: hypothetical protein EBZ69_09790, partial [Alphaproteobacteria bacterium]|nr:hypothetical protein [Alphaproteobacteria bacterium]